MTDRQSQTKFVSGVVSFVQNKRYAMDSQHKTKVTKLKDKVLIRALERCLVDKKCRLQRKARAIKNI
ncbi:MAG: hypothetical protein OQJ89_08955 [Kangiellaceae bacterium]|nr:hypothetical protein [Kangiellaceae bacterium]